MLMDWKPKYFNAEEYFHEHEKGKDFIISIYEFYGILKIKLIS